MTTFGLASIQLADGPAATPDGVFAAISETARRFPWVDMILIGELAINGVKLDQAEPADGPTETRLCELAKEVGKWLVPGSLYEKRNDAIYNTTPVISPAGEIIARHDKLYPFEPYEKTVACGSEYVVFEIAGIGKFGLAICYDIWFPEAIRSLAAMGAEVILAPTRTNTIDRDIEVAIARSNAAINQCYMAAINIGGPLGMGRSVVCGPGGEIIHECGTSYEAFAIELDFEYVRRCRDRGWQGLGQTLKSFRDSKIDFPFHASSEARKAALSGLGPLTMPKSDAGQSHEPAKPDDVKFKIVE